MFYSNCGHDLKGIAGDFCSNCGAKVVKESIKADVEPEGKKNHKLVAIIAGVVVLVAVVVALVVVLNGGGHVPYRPQALVGTWEAGDGTRTYFLRNGRGRTVDDNNISEFTWESIRLEKGFDFDAVSARIHYLMRLHHLYDRMTNEEVWATMRNERLDIYNEILTLSHLARINYYEHDIIVVRLEVDSHPNLPPRTTFYYLSGENTLRAFGGPIGEIFGTSMDISRRFTWETLTRAH